MHVRSNPLVKMVQQRVDAYLVPGPTREMIRQIRMRNLTYLSERKLNKLARLALANERRSIPGIIIEAGCALGGSAALLTACKSSKRRLKIFDVFGMIPPPSHHDGSDVEERYDEILSGSSTGICGDTYYGYREDLYNIVKENLKSLGYPAKENRVYLVKGLIQETLTVDEPVSLAHIDVDWYQSVMVSLERIVPFLSNGGAVVVDDYFDWSGCRQAVDDYFVGMPPVFQFDDSAGSLVITRR